MAIELNRPNHRESDDPNQIGIEWMVREIVRMYDVHAIWWGMNQHCDAALIL